MQQHKVPQQSMKDEIVATVNIQLMSGIVLCIIDVMIKVVLSSYNFHIPIPTIANHSSRCGVANH